MENFQITWVLIPIPFISMILTLIFIFWHTTENARILKKVNIFKKTGKYPIDDPSTTYWDAKGISYESYTRVPSINKEPELHEIKRFRADIEAHSKIFTYLKFSALTMVISIVIVGLTFDK